MKDLKKQGYKNMMLNYKIWLSGVAGGGIIDETKYALLKLIAEKGSIKSAAEEVGISYRKAWGDLKSAEEMLGYQLIEKTRGGSHGGQTIVTKRGKQLIEAYETLQQKFDDSIEEAFEEFKRNIQKK